MQIIPQCRYCQHLLPGESVKCKAFPKGIPGDILMNRLDHREKVEGDRGYQFKPVNKEADKSQKRAMTREYENLPLGTPEV